MLSQILTCETTICVAQVPGYSDPDVGLAWGFASKPGPESPGVQVLGVESGKLTKAAYSKRPHSRQQEQEDHQLMMISTPSAKPSAANRSKEAESTWNRAPVCPQSEDQIIRLRRGAHRRHI